jgi:ASC-1-like (ASCH) protein
MNKLNNILLVFSSIFIIWMKPHYQSTNKKRERQNPYEDTITESVVSEATRRGKISTKKPKVHLLPFRNLSDCPLYEQIILNNKTVEGRKNSEENQKISIGDTILLSDRSKGILECDVTYINKYLDVTDYLVSEGLESVFGNLEECKTVTSIEKGLELYGNFVSDSQIIKLKEEYGYGFLGIGIKFIHEYKKHFQTLNEPWFSFIRDGKKIVEGRLDKLWVKTLQPLDFIEFKRVKPKDESKEDDNVQTIDVIVTEVKRYKKFTDIFDEVGLDKILPGKNTYDDGLAVYRQWYSEEKEKELGVVGIFMKVIKR